MQEWKTMKKGSLLIGYARVSKADDQDTAAQVKSAAPGRLQTNLRGEGVRWQVGSAPTSKSIGAVEGRRRVGCLETGPPVPVSKRPPSHHGTSTGRRRRLPKRHRGGGYHDFRREDGDANAWQLRRIRTLDGP